MRQCQSGEMEGCPIPQVTASKRECAKLPRKRSVPEGSRSRLQPDEDGVRVERAHEPQSESPQGRSPRTWDLDREAVNAASTSDDRDGRHTFPGGAKQEPGRAPRQRRG